MRKKYMYLAYETSQKHFIYAYLALCDSPRQCCYSLRKQKQPDGVEDGVMGGGRMCYVEYHLV